MALKKDSERVKVAYSIKKETLNTLKLIAEKTNRPIGRMIDEIVESYKQANS